MGRSRTLVESDWHSLRYDKLAVKKKALKNQ
jgi:hypothetical protein